MDPFTIIVDTREQIPWEFGLHSTAKKKLDTGDYSIEGFEDIFTIERKRSVSEIANNITENRFKDVLDRMSKIKHKFMLFEFDLDDVYNYPVGSDVPKKVWDKLKINYKYILKYLSEIQVKHDIHIIYCGCSENAEKMAVSLMKRIYDIYHDEKQKDI